MSLVYLGLGSNLGDRLQNITTAIIKLSSIAKFKVCSSIWETSPWGLTDQNYFLNCVALFETTLQPLELLEEIARIEVGLGRERERFLVSLGTRFGPRTIDIDILFYDALIIDTPTLIIPHPLLHKRKFVLLPLSEIAPKLTHPILKKEIQELLKDINSKEDCCIFIRADKFSPKLVSVG